MWLWVSARIHPHRHRSICGRPTAGGLFPDPAGPVGGIGRVALGLVDEPHGMDPAEHPGQQGASADRQQALSAEAAA